MRRCPPCPAEVPVKGMKEARLEEGGPFAIGGPARDKSSVKFDIWLCRRLSVCSLIRARLRSTIELKTTLQQGTKLHTCSLPPSGEASKSPPHPPYVDLAQ